MSIVVVSVLSQYTCIQPLPPESPVMRCAAVNGTRTATARAAKMDDFMVGCSVDVVLKECVWVYLSVRVLLESVQSQALTRSPFLASMLSLECRDHVAAWKDLSLCDLLHSQVTVIEIRMPIVILQFM